MSCHRQRDLSSTSPGYSSPTEDDKANIIPPPIIDLISDEDAEDLSYRFDTDEDVDYRYVIDVDESVGHVLSSGYKDLEGLGWPFVRISNTASGVFGGDFISKT